MNTAAWAAWTIAEHLGIARNDPRFFLYSRLALARLRDDQATAERMRAALEAMRKSGLSHA
jgi:hypothetical protein